MLNNVFNYRRSQIFVNFLSLQQFLPKCYAYYMLWIYSAEEDPVCFPEEGTFAADQAKKKERKKRTLFSAWMSLQAKKSSWWGGGGGGEESHNFWWEGGGSL